MIKQLQMKTMLLLCALIIGSVSSAWGETSTLTFAAKCNGSGTADDGVAWTVKSDGSESNFDETKGIHYGTNSNAVKYIQLSTSEISGTITQIKVNASTANGVSATVGVTVGGSAFGGDEKSISSTATDYTFTGSASGEIVVTVTKPSSATKALYVKSVVVTYTTKNLSSITASGYKTTFYEKDAFEFGGTVTAHYDDSTTGDVTEDATFTGYDMSSTGNQTVTVSYGGKTTSYDITVNERPKYTVTFSVNGIESSNQYKENDPIVFPSDPSDIAGKVFVGWSEDPIVGTTDTKPDFYSSAKATSDITYYAVFATKTPGSLEEKVDNITRSKTGVDAGATGYSDWSGKTLISSAVYAGNSAGGANADSGDAIQLRTKNSNSGVVSTTSGGFVKKVVIAWADGTYSGTTIDIYGSNSAYSAASDLYGASAGDKLGSIVKGTSTEITISGEYKYVGLRSNNNALCVDQISITWQTGTPDTYSEFATTIPTTEDATISTAGWATYVPTHNVRFRSGTNAYIVKLANNETARLTPVEDVPAGTPVLLEGASGTHTMDFLASSSTDVSNNCLKVSTGVDIDGVYVLANGNNGIGFYLWTGGELNEGKVYLQIPTSSREFISLFDDTTTDITEMKDKKLNTKEVFNLNGMRVAQPQKGLYIVNGKKVVLK